jgi:hypothetical protein
MRRAGSGVGLEYSFTYGTMPATYSTSPLAFADHFSFYATFLP